MAKTIEGIFAKKMEKCPKEEREYHVNQKTNSEKNGEKVQHPNENRSVAGCSDKLGTPRLSGSKAKNGVKRKSSASISSSTHIASPVLSVTKTPITPVQRDGPKNAPGVLNETPVNHQATSRSSNACTQIEYCHTILTELLDTKHYPYASPFYKPVDVVLQNCPDYYDVIKRPMDLETVKNKIEKGLYKSPADFAYDIRLIFTNCYKYNSPEDQIVAKARRLQGFFEVLYAKMPDNVESAKTISPERPFKKIRSSSSSSSGKENTEMLEMSPKNSSRKKRLSKVKKSPLKVVEEVDVTSIAPVVHPVVTVPASESSETILGKSFSGFRGTNSHLRTSSSSDSDSSSSSSTSSSCSSSSSSECDSDNDTKDKSSSDSSDNSSGEDAESTAVKGSDSKKSDDRPTTIVNSSNSHNNSCSTDNANSQSTSLNWTTLVSPIVQNSKDMQEFLPLSSTPIANKPSESKVRNYNSWTNLAESYRNSPNSSDCKSKTVISFQEYRKRATESSFKQALLKEQFEKKKVLEQAQRKPSQIERKELTPTQEPKITVQCPPKASSPLPPEREQMRLLEQEKRRQLVANPINLNEQRDICAEFERMVFGKFRYFR